MEENAGAASLALSEADLKCIDAAFPGGNPRRGLEAQTRNNGSRQLDAFIRRAGIAIEPVTEEQAHIARQAFIDFGKDRHPAGLNYGDCCSYSLSKPTREPLLFKGKDLAKTDLTAAH